MCGGDMHAGGDKCKLKTHGSDGSPLICGGCCAPSGNGTLQKGGGNACKVGRGLPRWGAGIGAGLNRLGKFGRVVGESLSGCKGGCRLLSFDDDKEGAVRVFCQRLLHTVAIG
jgi:hypothetical protein